jgi:hypothetical protein
MEGVDALADGADEGHLHHHAGGAPIHGPGPAEPDVAAGIGGDIADQPGRHAGHRFEGGLGAVDDPHDALGRPDPDGAGGLDADALDVAVGETVVRGVDGEASGLVTNQSVVGGAPDAAVAPGANVPEHIAPHRRSIGAVEDREAGAVEAGKAVTGADPDVAVVRLGDPGNGVLRHALFGAPGMADILADGPVRIECERPVRPGDERSTGEYQSAEATEAAHQFS